MTIDQLRLHPNTIICVRTVQCALDKALLSSLKFEILILKHLISRLVQKTSKFGAFHFQLKSHVSFLPEKLLIINLSERLNCLVDAKIGSQFQ